MNQIEMEKIADALDPNHTNVIDLNEIVSVLKGFKRSRTLSKERMSDTEKIDHEVCLKFSQWLSSFLNVRTYYIFFPRVYILASLGTKSCLCD